MSTTKTKTRKTAPAPSAAALKAALAYRARQSRQSHPKGTFDKGSRWYPSSEEKCDCCEGVRSPSRAWPWSYMVHCRTMTHVASLHGVPLPEVRAALRAIQAGEVAP